jgi:two-component system NarL family sensor kinase
LADFQGDESAETGKAVRERWKEITFLESHDRMGQELPLEDVCQQVFDHLIPAMHSPAIASAMIELDSSASPQRTIA